MADRKVTLVTTTINVPKFLEGYLENAKENGHAEDSVEVIVIGDLKTPTEVRKYCEKLSSEYGYQVIYMSPDDQIEWSEDKDIEELSQTIPFNAIQRRNIGYLRAYERNADVIVSLDDDNLAYDEDIIEKFSEVGSVREVYEVDAPNNWFNCCYMLEYKDENPRDVYHRGFPYSKRDEEQEYDLEKSEKEIAIRAGLWVDVPDVDVITHLERSPRSVSLRERFDKPVALSEDNYCPVNTQNTAYDADMLPLLFAIPMGDEIKGMELSRFDDIWLGFFAEKILHSMDKTVAYGRPLSNHDRNTHHLKAELEHEAIGVRLNEIVVDILESIEISDDGYQNSYSELIDKLEFQIEEKEMDYEFESYLKKITDYMRTWLEACEKIMEDD